MDSERAWKWAERAGPVVIAPLCSVAALYYAAATYYGWDKQVPTPVIQSDPWWPPMTATPWLGIALLCIAVASVLTSWSMIFIRSRAKTASKKEAPPQGGGSDAIEVFGRGLFASEMVVTTSHLKTDRFVEITARCFNATGHSVYLGSIKGDISINEARGSGSGPELMRLPTPSLVRKTLRTDHIADRQDFLIALEQRIPSDVADKILDVTSEYRIQLDLGNLEILVCSHSQSSLCARLPLWDGITLARWPDRIETNRVIILRPQPIQIRVGV